MNLLVPGPTVVSKRVLRIYGKSFDRSPDLDNDYFSLYCETENLLLRHLDAPDHSAVVMSGEAMVVLWGALKSLLKPGDVVLCVANGVFGYGFADMARKLGCVVHVAECSDQEAINVRALDAAGVVPKLVTAVHVDTPSGVRNRNIGAVGRWCKQHGALFVLDAVASAFALPVKCKRWNVDVLLLGSQKCLSLPPDSGVALVSQRAWEVASSIDYAGYDAFLPFRNAVVEKYFPYTPNWRALAAWHMVLRDFDPKEASQRHEKAAKYVRRKIEKMGLKIYTSPATSSPTVTAVLIPSVWTWEKLDKALRERGVFFGGSFGNMAGKIFRIGHMGNQTKKKNLKKALKVLKKVVCY